MTTLPLHRALQLLLAGLFICSCSIVPPGGSPGTVAALKPKPGKALVVVYRLSGGFGGILAKYDLTANRVPFAYKMGRSAYTTYDAAPGDLVISGRLDRVTTQGPPLGQSILATAPFPILLSPTPEVPLPKFRLNVGPNEIHYIEIHFPGMHGAALREVSAATGAREVLKCRFHGPANP